MKKLEPYPIAVALFFISEIFFIVCMAGKFVLLQLGVEGFWHMHKIWEAILPGVNDLSFFSFILGLIEVGFGAYAAAYILAPTYNYLIRNKLVKSGFPPKPFLLRFKTLFLTVLTYVLILFTFCFVYDLFVPKEYDMSRLWKLLLPGFTGLSFGDYLIGAFDILIYSLYSSAIFSGVLNYFEKSESIEAN